MLWLVLLFSCTYSALATEWNCAAADGVFTLSTDCTINNDIDVTGKLNVTGIPDAQGNLPKIIGGGSNRLFKVESGGELVVKFLNLTGGMASETECSLPYSECAGGAVYVHGSQFHSIASVVTNNRAYYGGGVFCTNGANCTFMNSTVSHNTARQGGAGIYMWCIEEKICRLNIMSNTAIVSNVAPNLYADGAGLLVRYAITQIYESNIVNNIAKRHGGGIHAAFSFITLSGCNVSSNTIDEQGAGLRAEGNLYG